MTDLTLTAPIRYPRTAWSMWPRGRQIEAYAPWKASFANQRKDWRYYQIVEDTIVQGFDYRYFILEDAKGEVRAVQPFFLLDQDLLQGSGEFAAR